MKDEKGNLEEASGVAGRLGQPSCPGFPESKFSHAVKTSNLNWITSCRGITEGIQTLGEQQDCIGVQLELLNPQIVCHAVCIHTQVLSSGGRVNSFYQILQGCTPISDKLQGTFKFYLPIEHQILGYQEILIKD